MQDDSSVVSSNELPISTSPSDSETDSSSPPATDERAALRKMMVESQKTITSHLSQAAKSDIAKGRSIKRQRTTFDALLNARIRLQKALAVANSFSSPLAAHTNQDDPLQAAETAALTLWSTLDSL
ncbi:MAG: hypothetical protein Q9190_000917, partial [Brigantiaea leucoxantha]